MVKKGPNYAGLARIVTRMLVIHKSITNVDTADVLLQVEQLKVLLYCAKATALPNSFLEYLMCCSKRIAVKIKEISLSSNVNVPLPYG